MKEDINFNYKGELTKYFLKQTIIITLVIFIFFIASYKYFTRDFSIYIVWLMSVVGLLFLYMDIRFIIRIQKMQQEIDMLKFTINSLSKRVRNKK